MLAQPRQQKPPELLAFEVGREVMEMLRGAHAHICSVLEIMCTDIGSSPPARSLAPPHAGHRKWGLTALAAAGQKFVAKPEERLLGVVHALLHRAYKLPFSNAAEVPPSLKKELAGELRSSKAAWHAFTVPC